MAADVPPAAVEGPAAESQPCNLCGGAVQAAGDGLFVCASCGSTPRQRIARRTFQALPHGLIDWRLAALPGGPHGLRAQWFRATAESLHNPDFIALELPGPVSTDGSGAALAKSLASLSARGVAYVSSADTGSARPYRDSLHAMRAQLARQCMLCSVLAVDGGDPCSALHVPSWLLFRDRADAARWQQHLAVWSDPVPHAACQVDDPFAPLRAELMLWQDQQRDCTFWWRDDDLAQDSAALRRLAELAQRGQVPVLMAVIPARAHAHLARDTAHAGMSMLSFCQHGWGHVNHEPPGRPSSEFGRGRELAQAQADLARGFARMRELFGERFMPVLVPPWNSVSPELAAWLPALGLSGLSQHISQPLGAGIAGMVRVDTHVDIIDWSSEAHVLAPELLVERMVTTLQMRRSHRPDEPVGVLSHHRAMAEGNWAFLEQLQAVLAEFSCVRWLHPREIFQGAAA